MNTTLRNASIALVAALTAGIASAASWVNMHGIGCTVWDPTRLDTKTYWAEGLTIGEKVNQDNWVYCPVPTGQSQSATSIVLQYQQPQAGSINRIDLYNGNSFVRSVSVPAGIAGRNTMVITFPATSFPYGLAVAVYIPSRSVASLYTFSDAGAYWQ